MRDNRTYLIKFDDQTVVAEERWTISRARDTYGWNVCKLYVNGQVVAGCNGGGYDMVGTVFGTYLERAFSARLVERIKEHHYGLYFFDPNYDVGKQKAPVDDLFIKDGDPELTIEEAEKQGKSLGLARYQAAYSATTKLPDETHTVAHIDGGCGMSSVERIAKSIGVTIEMVPVVQRKKARRYESAY
jgi:hypothetical protein